MSLGSVIRNKREQHKLTLDEVSRRTGYSKPYISTVETGRVKNPPADELLIKLEEILEFEKGTLLHIAHMEKLPADIRQAFESSQAENEHWRSLLQDLMRSQPKLGERLKGGKFYDRLVKADQNCVKMATAGRLVPVINKVTAGYPVDYDDMDYPPGSADDYVRCPDLHDPNAFAVRVVGDSMEPKYQEGDIIIFSPNSQVNNGDDCFVRLTDPHETTFKQVFFESDGQIRLQPRNHIYPPLILSQKKVNGIWKAVVKYEKLV